ncbi:MAG: DUF2892 domain-containing protein [Cyanobacteria bacterium]|nr:DUF2892 domain-containing protein [Cyanobacteriota bacterium]
MNNASNCGTSRSPVWSIDRQVRFLSGILVILGISLSFVVHPAFVSLSVIVALGMIISAVAGSCAMGIIVSWFPWNRA